MGGGVRGVVRGLVRLPSSVPVKSPAMSVAPLQRKELWPSAKVKGGDKVAPYIPVIREDLDDGRLSSSCSVNAPSLLGGNARYNSRWTPLPLYAVFDDGSHLDRLRLSLSVDLR